METPTIEAQARAEFAAENFRDMVEQRKRQLRERAGRPWWIRWCPWTVEVRREPCIRYQHISGEVFTFENGRCISTITFRRIPA